MPRSRPFSFIAESIRERASALGGEGRFAEAVLEYQVLVDVDPSDVESGLELARLLVALGKRGRAAEELLRVAGALAGLGEGARALAVAERALELEPSRVVRSGLAPLVSALGAAAAELCERIAGVHLMAERRQEARGVLGLLVEVDPSELSRRLRLAELDLSLGRIDEARVGLRLVADGLRAHGRTTELLRVLEMMHRHTGPDEAVLRELAAIYLRCGQPRRALEKLEALHRVAPHDRMAVERLAREHARLGRLEISLRLLERLIALVVEQAERGELRAVLRRASSWSSDSSYQRVVESLGLAALRPGGVSVDARSLRGPDPRVGPRVGTRRWSSPPPLPRAMRRSARARAASGEIHILDPEADAELIVEPVVLGAEGSAVLALE